MEKKSVSFNGKIISYNVAGAGKAVMLVHGFGIDSSAWNEQVEFLRKDYFVIAPELPGIGASELIEDVSMENLATLMKDIAAAEEVEELVLIGHSMGGYATLAFAEKYPEMLLGFGLFHSSAGADNEEKIASRKKGIEFTKKNGARMFLQTSAPNMFSDDTKENNPTLYEKYLGDLPELNEETVVAYYEAMMQRPDRTQVLEDAKVPVLFVFGEGDAIIPLEKGLEQASLPSTSVIHILKKSGHLGMLEEPAETNKIVYDYLSGLK